MLEEVFGGSYDITIVGLYGLVTTSAIAHLRLRLAQPAARESKTASWDCGLWLRGCWGVHQDPLNIATVVGR